MERGFSIADDEKSITLLFGSKEMTIPFPDGITIKQWNDAWDLYDNGAFVQRAFPFLNDGQREFLITGITPDQWSEMFGDEEDE